MMRWGYIVPVNRSTRSCFITFHLLTHLIISAFASWWLCTGPLGQGHFPAVSTSASSVVVYFPFSNRYTAFCCCRGHLNAAPMLLSFQNLCRLCRFKTEIKEKTWGKVSSQRTPLGGLLIELGVKASLGCWAGGVWRHAGQTACHHSSTKRCIIP